MRDTYTVMNPIMLRFRPIAPKPSGGQDVSAAAELETRNGTRTKRKYVRVRGRQSTKRKTGEEGRSSPTEKSGIDCSSREKGAVTLQLLPERSGSEKFYYTSSALKLPEIDRCKADDEVCCGKVDAEGDCGGGTLVNVRSVTKTWITVECVTEAYVDYSGVGLGVSDGEKIKNLQADTCPGFVSDDSNNVVWVNEAYRKLLGEGEGVMAWLVVKEKLPYVAPSFACRVRMIQQKKHGHKSNRIVPCDVWRMESAGFAWRMDVRTALGLRI